jgi:hypothetical protein
MVPTQRQHSIGDITSYAAFLAFLIALGPKLQALWPKINALLAAAMDLGASIKTMFPAAAPAVPAAPQTPPATQPQPTDGTLSEVLPASDDEIAALETEVATLIAGPNGAFDGSWFRTAWGFLSKHPELVAGIKALVSLAISGA